ncbi:MAG: hypothetical protein RQ767_07380, partial [Thermovirgaceae bacterium]|nr:hypothetical protein [Thermovirgaceae bacterium]
SGNWMFFISVPADLLDVNIHPGKSEVRVHSSLPLFETVRKTAIGLIEGNHIDPGLIMSPGRSSGGYQSGEAERGRIMSLRNEPGNYFCRVNEAPGPGSGVVGEVPGDPDLSYIGQMGSGYLLFNGDEELVVVDPHAAHERIVYEKFSAEERGGSSQRISFPEQIPPTLSERIGDFRESLEKEGFAFEERSGALYLAAIPGSGYCSSPLEALRSWIRTLDDRAEDVRSQEGLSAIKACHSSVRLGEKISNEEAVRLLEDLFACKNPTMCPHGRPTLIRLRSRDIARLFGRE